MQTGSREAFSALYEEFWEPLLNTATKVLRSADDAADVVQEVFLSLWNRRNELDVKGSLEAYLHTSVRYKCINFIEKNLHQHDYLVLMKETAAHQNFQGADTDLMMKQLREAISRVVDSMPPKMQQAYRLSREQHLTHKQIAEQMGISQETVKKHIQHALEMIKIVIHDYSLELLLLLGLTAL